MSDTDDSVLAEIIESAKAHTGRSSITPQTRLYADLGMTGDDAQAFLLAFAIKHDVDLGALTWLRYFDDEGVDLFSPALTLGVSIISPSFAMRWQRARDAEREITIAHLAEVARAKVWIIPDDTHRRQRAYSPLNLIFSVIATLMQAFFVLLGIIVAWALLTGRMGDVKALALLGVIAVSVLPFFFAYASWRHISAKLASAEG